jgi:serine/threonine protein kinase
MVQTTDVGTIRYMAPEIVFGPYDHRADIYSWGLLAWELLLICMRPSASPHALFKRAVGRGAAHAHVERAASERRPQDGLAVDGEPHRELLAHVARPAPIHDGGCRARVDSCRADAAHPGAGRRRRWGQLLQPHPLLMGQRLNAGPKGEHETFERANASSREPDPAERVDNDERPRRARPRGAGRERAQVGGGVHRYTVGRLE